MLEFEPSGLVYRDVRLNQSYITSLCIINPLTAPIEFTIRPSSSRYNVTPNKVNLQGGQSIVVSIRLFLSHYPNYTKGIKGQEDSLIIKSAYFEQKVDVTFYLHSRDKDTASSRSPSPSSRRLGSTSNTSNTNDLVSSYNASNINTPYTVSNIPHRSKDMYDTINELQSQVTSKDNKIKQMSDIILQLESKFPSMQEIIHSRVEQEKLQFTEKTEQILKICRQKDENIRLLQARLNELTIRDEEINNSNAIITSVFNYTGGGSSDDFDSFKSSHKNVLDKRVENIIANLRSKLKVEEETHEQCKQQLQESQYIATQLRDEIKQYENRTTAAAAATQSLSSQYQELVGLREQSLDQSEQIEVLVSELEMLRSRSTSSVSLDEAKNEIIRLNNELKDQQHKYDSLQSAHMDLSQQVMDHLHVQNQAAITAATNSNDNTNAQTRLDDDLHDSTRLSSTRELLDAGKNIATVNLYIERLERVEEKNSLLENRCRDYEASHNDLSRKCKEYEALLTTYKDSNSTLTSRVHDIEIENEELIHKLNDKEDQLKFALERVSEQSDKTSMQDAHLWWTYVWHELKRQNLEKGKLNDAIGISSSNTGNTHAYSSSSAKLQTFTILSDDSNGIQATNNESNQQYTSHLREAMRSQAIEISALRQEAIAKKITVNKDVAALKDQLELCRREISRLNTVIRTHKNDKEMKINELTSTVKTLQARSDMHAVVATVKQELETEKLSNHHLRSDLDAFRSMLEDEKVRVLSLRKEVSLTQAILDKDIILRSIIDIPGIDPASLIEVMGGHMIHLKSELSIAKSAAAQSQSQVNSLQKSLNHAMKSRATLAASDSIPDGDHNIGSSSSSGGSSNSGSVGDNKQATSSTAAGDDASLLTSFDYEGKVSLIIDSHCTPQKILDSLDASILAQKVLMQETLISELRVRLDELTDDVLKAEGSRLHLDEYESKSKIELEGSIRRQEILQTSLNDAKVEITTLRQKCTEFENRIVDIQQQQALQLKSGNDMNDTMTASSLGDSSDCHVNIDELNDELAATKNVLRERTAQLKIIMETLDTFQLANVNTSTRSTGNRDNIDLDAVDDHTNLMDLAYHTTNPVSASSTIPSFETSWSMQALVKRVVDLTMDLSSQTARSALDQRKSSHLEEECRRRTKDIGRLKASLKKEEDVNTHVNVKLIQLSSHIADVEKVRIVESKKLQNECEELAEALRAAEAQMKSDAITIDELKQKVRINEQLDFQQWLESVVINDTIAISKSSNKENDQPQSENTSSSQSVQSTAGVKELLTMLINQWRDHSTAYPTRPSHLVGNSTGVTSKNEQMFLQRVTDLVLAANERCVRAQNQLLSIEARSERSDTTCRIYKHRLKSCIQHLHRYRNRAYAAEQYIANEKKHRVVSHDRLSMLNMRFLKDERQKLLHAYNSITEERQQRQLSDAKQSIQLMQNRKLEMRVAELEARGTSSIRERENAVAALEGRLKLSEESLHKFVRVELPRIVSGFPVTEDSSLSSAHNIDGLFATGNHDSSGSAFDRTYALTQALCAAKSVQAVQDMRLTGVLEKNSILKERNLELEGILQKWKDEIANASTIAKHYEEKSLSLINNTESIQAISKLNDQLHACNGTILDLEEDNIDLKGRLGHSNSRAEEMKRLVDAIVKEEETLKSKATQQITRLRLQLEAEHAIELRDMREAYEADLKLLTAEYERVAVVAESVRASTNDSIWQRKKIAEIVNHSTNSNSNNNNESSNDESVDQALSPSGTKARSAAPRSRRTSVSGTNGSRSATVASTARRASTSTFAASEYHSSSSDSNVDKTSHEDRLVELRRLLETEKALHRQAQGEILQLSSLLSAYQTGSNSNSNSNSSSSGGVSQPLSPTRRSTVSDHQYVDVLREDRSLWPSIGTQLEELLNVLRSVPHHHHVTDNIVKTSITMVMRIKTICSDTMYIDSHSKHESYSNAAMTSLDIDTASGSPDIKKSLQSLASRVIQVEHDFSHSEMTERQTHLLRELHNRVIDIEAAMSEELEHQKRITSHEKNELLRIIDSKSAEIDTLRNDGSQACDNIRSTYESILHSQQDALDTQIAAAGSEITRLEELLYRAQSELDKAKQLTSTHVDDASRLQSEVLSHRNIINDINAAHKADIDAVSASLSSALAAVKEKDSIISKLEYKLQQQHQQQQHDQSQAHDTSVNTAAGAVADSPVLLDAEDKIRKLEYQFRMKSSELHAVMNALSKSGSASNDSSMYVPTDGVIDESNATNSNISISVPVLIPPASSADDRSIRMMSIPLEYRTEMYEARIAAAESEVASLQEDLYKERKLNSSLKAQLSSLESQEKVCHYSDSDTTVGKDTGIRETVVHEQVSGTVPSAMAAAAAIAEVYLRETSMDFQLPEEMTREKVRQFVKRMNDLRRVGRSEILKLKQSLHTSHILEARSNEEINRLKLQVNDVKAQLHTLRDDSHRKAKLLTSLRAAKTAESHSLEQTKIDAKENEEISKRLQRSLLSKDILIKDLKYKLESLQEVQDIKRTQEAHMAVLAGGVLSQLDSSDSSVVDLRGRLRVLEVERTRSKALIKTSKDRCAELENEVKLLKEEIDKLSKLTESSQQLRVTATRKDQLYKSMKAQLDKMKVEYDTLKQEYDTYKTDSERRLRQLHRQLDSYEKRSIDLQKEYDKARNTHVHPPIMMSAEPTGYRVYSTGAATAASAVSGIDDSSGIVDDEDDSDDDNDRRRLVASNRPITQISASVNNATGIATSSRSMPSVIPSRRGGGSDTSVAKAVTSSAPSTFMAQPNLQVPKVLSASTTADLTDVMAALYGKL